MNLKKQDEIKNRLKNVTARIEEVQGGARTCPCGGVFCGMIFNVKIGAHLNVIEAVSVDAMLGETTFDEWAKMVEDTLTDLEKVVDAEEAETTPITQSRANA